MPSTSKSQQRLFGWALACKRGTSKSCPASVKKLADSMPEDELEKFAKTSHKDLPERVKESLEEILSVYSQIVEAEIGESLENYDYEMSNEDVNEAKSLEIEQPKGKSFANAKKEEPTKKLSDAKSEKVTSKELPNAKVEVEGGKNEILQPAGKSISNAKTVPAGDEIGGVKKNESPSVDNKTDEPDHSWNKPNPGMEKAEKSPFSNVYTPQVHKFPMGKAKNERRLYDFDQFLKIINYKTHDGILQKGHGQNLSGGSAA